MSEGKKAKGSSGANKKKKARNSHLKLFTDEMIDKLRRELRLIDRAIAALERIARLREQRRSTKRRSSD